MPTPLNFPSPGLINRPLSVTLPLPAVGQLGTSLSQKLNAEGHLAAS